MSLRPNSESISVRPLIIRNAKATVLIDKLAELQSKKHKLEALMLESVRRMSQACKQHAEALATIVEKRESEASKVLASEK